MFNDLFRCILSFLFWHLRFFHLYKFISKLKIKSFSVSEFKIELCFSSFFSAIFHPTSFSSVNFKLISHLSLFLQFTKRFLLKFFVLFPSRWFIFTRNSFKMYTASVNIWEFKSGCHLSSLSLHVDAAALLSLTRLLPSAIASRSSTFRFLAVTYWLANLFPWLNLIEFEALLCKKYLKYCTILRKNARESHWEWSRTRFMFSASCFFWYCQKLIAELAMLLIVLGSRPERRSLSKIYCAVKKHWDSITYLFAVHW